MYLSFSPIWPWPWLAVVAASLLAVVVWIYWTTLREQSGRWRWAVFAARMAALGMALAAMLRPSIVFQETRKQSASLVLLQDRSRSMLVADAWDGLPRWQAMEQTLERSDAQLAELAESLEIKQFDFADRIREVALPGETPDGNQTALGDVLRETLREASGRVAAVVLLTDGANTTGTPPLSAAQALRDQGVPVYTVGFGQQTAVEASRDLALRSITADPTVFEKNRLVVSGELDARGFAQERVQLQLLFDDQLAASETLQLPPSDSRVKVELSYVPVVPGEHKVTLAVAEPEPRRGELVETNNRISTYVTVIPGGLRVLYLDGGIEGGEARFITRALNASPDIQVDFRWVRGPLREATGSLFDPGAYDVFLIRDVPKASGSNRGIPDAALERLAEAVEQGAGFAMIGGPRSFGPGGYDRTPVAEILPVTIHRGDPQIDRPLQMLPTPEGLAHFVLRLGEPGETAELWRSFHPLKGASAFSDVKPRAQVLAESPDHIPLVVAQDYAAGRTMAIAGDTSWLWQFQSAQGRTFHHRFWRQVVLWLARKEAGENQIDVQLNKRRLAAGESLELTAALLDPTGAPATDVELQAIITPPDGTAEPVQLLPHGERMRGTFWGTERAGDYRVQVSARRNGQEVGSPKEVRFLVYQDDTELNAPAADTDLLKRIAELTRGRYVRPEELPRLLEELGEEDLNLEIERLTYLRLWDNWPFLLLFVTLLSTEWVLRKWKGLV